MEEKTNTRPPLRHASLFSGIGGFDLAAEWAGWENQFFCDFDSFCTTILKHHFPNATSYSDIKKTDFTPWRRKVDILSGGFPCQPFSCAGKRRGTEDDRHLWPEMLRAIREIRPRWVLGENVLGIVNWNGGMVFEQVCADLEAENYTVQPYVLPAASVNAPHRRYRTWFVAHSNEYTTERDTGKLSHPDGEKELSPWNEIQHFDESDPSQRLFVPDHVRYTHSDKPDQVGRGQKNETPESSGVRTVDLSGTRRESNWPNFVSTATGFIRKWITSDTGGIGLETVGNDQRGEGEIYRAEVPNGYKYGYLSEDWSRFPTQSPICRGNDGVSDLLDGITFPKWRRESIKAYGNAIVPQVAYRIFKVIDKLEKAS